MALATIGLDLYQIGGEVEAGVVNLVDVFDTDNKEWRSASSKPTAVADANAAVLFGEIYVPGGRLADSNPTAVVEAYSPSKDAWRPVAPLPTPLAGSVVISHGDLLYVFGGWDGTEFLSEGYVYDPSSDEWRSLPSMKTSRAYASGAALASKLFVIGGFDGESELDNCEYFDISEELWFPCPAMADPRAGAGAAVLGNKLLYVIGGGIDGSVATGEVYDAASGSWEPISMPMIKTGSSWYDLGVTNLESRIYVMGGRQDGELVDNSYIYSPLIHQLFLPAVGTD
jgi:N-acetylneuraminic acid mutarotase